MLLILLCGWRIHSLSESHVYTVDPPLILDPDSQDTVNQWVDVREPAVSLGLAFSVTQ